MIKADKYITSLFLKLTDKTYPHGTEDILVERLIKDGTFPKDIQQDPHGNWFYQIGHGSRTIFASHLDTVTDKHQKVIHKFEGNFIKTDGTTTLGADDKAGTSILIWMMKNKVPGLYYFFIGEEVGCIGSGLAAKYGDFEGNYDRIISFDRRDTDSIITHQSWSRSCSDDFANELCSQLNIAENTFKYIKDDGGVYTDSAEFVDIIPECTNVSVGYYSEHSKSEKQDIKHLIKLSEACVKVDWENLPTSRNPKIKESKYSNYTSNYNHGSSYKAGKTSGSWSRTSSDIYDDDYYDRFDNFTEYPRRVLLEQNEEEFFSQMGQTSNKKKRSRRAKKNPKTFYDTGAGLVEISVDSKQYKWFGCKLVEPISLNELEIAKEQYMLDSEYEKFFYESLKEVISKKESI